MAAFKHGDWEALLDSGVDLKEKDSNKRVQRDKCPSQWGQLKQSLRLDLCQVSRVPGAAVARGGRGRTEMPAAGLWVAGKWKDLGFPSETAESG